MNNPTQQKSVTRHTIIVMLAIGLGFVFYSLLAQLSGYLTIHGFRFNFVEQVKDILLRVWLPWVLFSPLIVLITRRIPIRPDKWLYYIPLHVLVFLGLTLIHLSIRSYHYHYFEDMSDNMATYDAWQHIGHFLFGDRVFLFNAIIYTTIVCSFNLRSAYSIVEEKELEATSLAHKLTESKLHALRMQVNPHFLFNALNAISVLVLKEENDKASEMIEQLSMFFRGTLDETDQQWVPLEKELELISQYLAIEQVRFGDRLSVEKHFDRDVLTAPIPAMILQPLVENAIRHGLEEKESAGHLSIECKGQEGRLHIQITDDGVGCEFEKDANFKAGIGLSNVQQRLNQLYKGQHVFQVSGEHGRGVTVSMILPLSH